MGKGYHTAVWYYDSLLYPWYHCCCQNILDITALQPHSLSLISVCAAAVRLSSAVTACQDIFQQAVSAAARCFLVQQYLDCSTAVCQQAVVYTCADVTGTVVCSSYLRLSGKFTSSLVYQIDGLPQVYRSRKQADCDKS